MIPSIQGVRSVVALLDYDYDSERSMSSGFHDAACSKKPTRVQKAVRKSNGLFGGITCCQAPAPGACRWCEGTDGVGCTLVSVEERPWGDGTPHLCPGIFKRTECHARSDNVAKQSGVPGVNWCRTAMAPKLDSKRKELYRTHQCFALKKFMGPGEAQADAAALEAAFAFRAELVKKIPRDLE